MPENLENVIPETPEDVSDTVNEQSPNKPTIDEENCSEDHVLVNSPSNKNVKTVSVEKDHSEPADQGKNDD
ncbi:hypothetical protein A2U01_0104201, partial [Trifolium medium]|nr:hypothetical protein [Trifolium medium]